MVLKSIKQTFDKNNIFAHPTPHFPGSIFAVAFIKL